MSLKFMYLLKERIKKEHLMLVVNKYDYSNIDLSLAKTCKNMSKKYKLAEIKVEIISGYKIIYRMIISI